MFKKRTRLKLIGVLGLFIGVLGYSTHAFAMERHAVYFDRNYGGTSMVPDEKAMAQKEFTNTIDPYSKYQIVDASQPKIDVINALESTFGNSEEEDINYLIFHSHGWSGGIIDFSFSELRSILDQYKGHFVLVLSACESGGMISKQNTTAGEIEDSFIKAFSEPRARSGEFKNSKYNVFCACTQSQSAYNNGKYGFFIKACFDSSKINPSDGCCNADYNKDNIVVPTELEQYLASHGNVGTKATPVAQVTDYDLPVFATNRSTFDFKGIGTSAGKDTHFAQLKYNGDHTATLKEGVKMYGCPIHPYFEGIYASILAKDKDGNTLFTKEFKGTDYVQAKEEKFSLPEGATLTLYHAEGTSGRYETSNDKELKQNAVGNTYYYVVKNGILSQQMNKQEFNFLGLGDYKFAQLDIVNGVAKLDSKYTQYGSHCYFKDNVYASVVVNDLTEKEVFKKEYKGNKNTPAGLDNIELKEGYTLTIHHEEPGRLKTNDDTNLHKESSKDFHYTFTNGYLIEQ